MKSKILVIFLFLLVAVTVVSAGEMDDWAYRKQITLNNSGSDLTDYQLKFTVYRSSGSDSGFTVYVSDKCQGDYDDIRFTTSDGLTLCNYWIETSDSSSATIWVKVPSIPAGNTILYLYYGNPNATAISNGDNTFVFFDDFPGTSLNSEKWTIVSSTGISVADSQFKVSYTSGSSTYGTIRSIPALGPNVALRIRLQTQTYWTHAGFGAADHSGTGSSVGWVYRTNYESAIYTGAQSSNWWLPPRTGSLSLTDGDVISDPPSGWFTDEFAVPANAPLQWRRNDGAWTYSTRYNGISSAQPLEINHFRYFGPMACDWVIIRKYSTTEPTVSSWGSEESQVRIINTNFSATPTSGESPLTVYLSDASTGCTTWPNSSINIDYWEWDFGDGSPKNYQQNPAHTYTQTGYFNVSLKSGNLTYGEYNTTIKNNYINVVVNPNVPVAEFTATPTCANTGTTIYFIDYSTGGGLYAWNWSFGDGTYSTLRNPTHQYSSNGLYDISLTVWGAYGSDTETKSGYIQIPCPTPTPTPTPTPSPTPIPTPTGTPPIQGEIPQARIPVLGFMVLAWVDLGLILYTFIDNENRNYMHIYSAVIAVILSFLLAVSLTNGFITEAHVLTDKEVTVNSSVLSTHLVEHVAVTDTGWSWFFAFLGVMMLIICVLSAIEAVKENTEEVM